MGKLTDADVVRFWSKVQRSDTCWEWTASISGSGYGLFSIRHRSATPAKAHRVSYEIHNGPIPGNMHVLHTCDNRSCVRPDHLYLGTNADNVRDRVTRGRTRTWATERARLGERHPRAKLTDEIVLGARVAVASGEATIIDLARQHGVAFATMQAAVRGKTWTHLTA